MSRIVTNIFASVDGIVDADSDWQFPYFDEELFGWVGAAWERASTVLMGRPSFEGYEQLRVEHPDSPALAFLDATPTYVVSRTMTEPPREGVEIIRDDAERRIRALREDAPGDLLLMGSAGLMRWLLERGLIDELNVMVLPIVVGAGTRLLDGDTEMRTALRLERSRPLTSGAIELLYTPAAPSQAV
ncbi:MAG: dihydrofolate reductase family protein [Ornithinimicrobium sp.]